LPRTFCSKAPRAITLIYLINIEVEGFNQLINTRHQKKASKRGKIALTFVARNPLACDPNMPPILVAVLVVEVVVTYFADIFFPRVPDVFCKLVHMEKRVEVLTFVLFTVPGLHTSSGSNDVFAQTDCIAC
jgi:hypothetical protein